MYTYRNVWPSLPSWNSLSRRANELTFRQTATVRYRTSFHLRTHNVHSHAFRWTSGWDKRTSFSLWFMFISLHKIVKMLLSCSSHWTCHISTICVTVFGIVASQFYKLQGLLSATSTVIANNPMLELHSVVPNLSLTALSGFEPCHSSRTTPFCKEYIVISTSFLSHGFACRKLSFFAFSVLNLYTFKPS